jgi:DNA modification methylase
MIPYYKTDNCELYRCDNLELLESLPDNYIDLIYCDILYNTGRKFKDYDDKLGTAQQAIEWYEPRLFEMKRILKENGSIYIHADFRLIHYIKVKMDEIFGTNNFINEIIWKYGLGGSGKKSFSKKHDNILLYSNSEKYTFNVQYEHATSNKMKGQLKKMIDVWDIPNINNMAKERLTYDTQKPKELLDIIIKTSSNTNDIVADFFMGSGTAGEVALELNRQFIGCDIGDNACKISKERLEKYNKK